MRANRNPIRERTLALFAGVPKRWRSDNQADWVSVERAVLAHYKNEGWSGDSGEGKIVLSLIKAASFVEFPEKHHSTFVEALYSANIGCIDVGDLNIRMGRRPDAPPSFAVEQFNREQMEGLIGIPEMIANIFTATEERISKNFGIMTGTGTCTLSFFPTLTLENILGLFAALGNRRLSQIAAIFANNPYAFRSGWPDLTLWRGTEVVFKEIKAPGDRARENQLQTIESILLPLGFDVEFVNIKPIRISPG